MLQVKIKDDTGNTIGQNIRRIRNKIEDDPSKPKYIQTVWGYGYCFRKDE